jgi:hypothetical protein
MYMAHYLLFRAAGFTAWIGTIVVVQNAVSSLTSSHLFDFTHGWLYVFGVGVAGGMMRRVATGTAASELDSDESLGRASDIQCRTRPDNPLWIERH